MVCFIVVHLFILRPLIYLPTTDKHNITISRRRRTAGKDAKYSTNRVRRAETSSLGSDKSSEESAADKDGTVKRTQPSAAQCEFDGPFLMYVA